MRQIIATIIPVVAIVALGACAPDIASGSYLCGQNATCPVGQSCNGPDNTCVVAGAAMSFACEPEMVTEPDDTAAQAHVIANLGCVSIPFVNANCMLVGDTEDWVRFVAPTGCSAVQVETRVTFPLAFERLGLELWDLDRMMKLVDDTTCPTAGPSGEEIRCIQMTLTGGTSYGIKVHPAGDGNCNGNCSYNRYTLRVQLSTPG
jgi:hypothetical protein